MSIGISILALDMSIFWVLCIYLRFNILFCCKICKAIPIFILILISLATFFIFKALVPLLQCCLRREYFSNLLFGLLKTLKKYCSITFRFEEFLNFVAVD